MPRRSTTRTTDPPVARPRAADFQTLIGVESITPNGVNPRRHVDGAGLVDSVRAVGVIQPIIVRALHSEDHVDPDGYEVVAGARRLAAARAAGLSMIPCVIKDLTDDEALEHALTENVMREDMNPVDEALGYKRLVERLTGEGKTYANVAARIGQTESHVYRRLRLLDLDAPLLTALAEGRLSIGHAERLVRLPKALRKEAADLDLGVVWYRSPLLEGDGKWTPTAEDLRPVHDLDAFARRRTHFDPTSTDVRHFQPELATAIDAAAGAAVREPHDAVLVEEAEVPTIVELSEATMARSMMRAAKGAKIPLRPAHWREVTTSKGRCEFTVRGVVTHGGPSRLLEVCVTRRCTKHFPPAKKAKATRAREDAQARQDSYAAQEAKREAARKAWDVTVEAMAPLIADHLRAATCTAPLVRALLNDWDLKKILAFYDVPLTDKTAAQVLALSALDLYSRERLVKTARLFRFDVAAAERAIAAASKKAAAKKGGAA